jgi:peptidoglycan hydrolase-like protein with peptidoglycan-binding domain
VASTLSVRGDCLRLPFKNLVLSSAILILLAGVCPAKTTAKHKTAKTKNGAHASAKSVSHSKTSRKGRHSAKVRKAAWKHHGQQNIDSDRVREIQQALIREKYLDGEPTGYWDTQTQTAMSRFQNDNGWQTKVTPDSRALIKLGLGPNHNADGTINSAEISTGVPATTSTSASSSAPNRQ